MKSGATTTAPSGFSSKRRRLDANQCAVVLVGDHVNEPVGSLTNVANPLMQIRQQPLAAQLLELVVHDHALERARARNLANPCAADEEIALPRWEAVARIEGEPGWRDRRQPE